MNLKIIHKHDKNFILASGFWSKERAEKWIEKFDPQMWVDKTLKGEDLIIVEEN